MHTRDAGYRQPNSCSSLRKELYMLQDRTPCCRTKHRYVGAGELNSVCGAPHYSLNRLTRADEECLSGAVSIASVPMNVQVMPDTQSHGV